MKTLIFIKTDRSGCLRLIPYVQSALGVTPVHYFDAFDAKCGEEMIEQIITGKLRDQEGVWYINEGAFPDKESYFFERIKAEVDCLLTVHYCIANKTYIEVNKARLTSLEPGDRFVIPRESAIGGLLKPYNFSGGVNEAGQEK